MPLMAYCPLAQGGGLRRGLLASPAVRAAAQAHGGLRLPGAAGIFAGAARRNAHSAQFRGETHPGECGGAGHPPDCGGAGRAGRRFPAPNRPTPLDISYKISKRTGVRIGCERSAVQWHRNPPKSFKSRTPTMWAVAVHDLPAGTRVRPGLVTRDPIPQAHKIALQDIPARRQDHPLRRGAGLCQGGHPRRQLDQRAYAGPARKPLAERYALRHPHCPQGGAACPHPHHLDGLPQQGGAPAGTRNLLGHRDHRASAPPAC